MRTPRTRKIPAYRKRIIRGRPTAMVTLYDVTTGKRFEKSLGAHGSPESQSAYARELNAWEARGRRIEFAPRESKTANGLTVTELLWEYFQGIKDQTGRSELCKIKAAVRWFRLYCGDL